MNCPGCGAALQLGMQKEWLPCDYCGQNHWADPNADGVRILGEGSKYPCPVCHGALVLADLAGEHILYCSDCGGMLIEMGRFVPIIAVLRAARGSFTATPTTRNPWEMDRRLKCPYCEAQMDTHPYGGPGNIVIDNCRSCEVNWLDRGEMGRIVAAPDRQYGQPRAEGAVVKGAVVIEER